MGERVARRGVFISRGETGEGVPPIVNSKMGHHARFALSRTSNKFKMLPFVDRIAILQCYPVVSLASWATGDSPSIYFRNEADRRGSVDLEARAIKWKGKRSHRRPGSSRQWSTDGWALGRACCPSPTVPRPPGLGRSGLRRAERSLRPPQRLAMAIKPKQYLIASILISAVIAGGLARTASGQQADKDLSEGLVPRGIGPCTDSASQKEQLNLEDQRHALASSRLSSTLEAAHKSGGADSGHAAAVIQQQIDSENQLHECTARWIHQGCPQSQSPCQPSIWDQLRSYVQPGGTHENPGCGQNIKSPWVQQGSIIGCIRSFVPCQSITVQVMPEGDPQAYAYAPGSTVTFTQADSAIGIPSARFAREYLAWSGDQTRRGLGWDGPLLRGYVALGYRHPARQRRRPPVAPRRPLRIRKRAGLICRRESFAPRRVSSGMKMARL